MRAFSRFVLVGLVLLTAASALHAQMKRIVFIRNGRELTIIGEVEETDDGYVVEPVDLPTVRLKKSEVVRITDYVEPATEYRRRRAEIEAGDFDALYELAEWAVEHDLYGKAVEDLEEIIRNRPNHLRAKLLLQRVKLLIRNRDGGDDDDDGGGRVDETKKDLVPMSDVYRIRRAELRRNERRLPLELRDDLARRFAERMQGTENFRDPDSERRFLATSRWNQAMYILEHTSEGDPMREEIIIKGDPEFMREFVRDVWPVVSRQCGSDRCHGGDRAPGGLKLFGTSRDPRSRYTNFVILDGVVAGGDRRLIDRDTPEDSLVLQYLLPPDAARFRHPGEVRPFFRSPRDSRYRRIRRWISELEHFPHHPDYNLSYKPPFGMKLVFREDKSDLLVPEEPTPEREQPQPDQPPQEGGGNAPSP